MTADDDHAGAAILIALAANVGVAASKLVAFVATHSSSLLAEAIHSIADTVNEVLLLVGRRASERPPSREHPFGYARNRYVFSFVVAIILFFGSGLLVGARGIVRLRDPQPVDHAAWAIAVLVIAMGLEGTSLFAAARRSKLASGDRPLRHFVQHAKTPELVVVLFEDFGALIGIALAMAGVIATIVTGDGLYDAAATCAIGVLMVGLSLALARKTRSLLIGESAHGVVRDDIERAAIGGEIRGLVQLRTQHLGPDDLLIAALVRVSPDATIRAVTEAIGAAKVRIREAVRYDCFIYLEPQIAVSPQNKDAPEPST